MGVIAAREVENGLLDETAVLEALRSNECLATVKKRGGTQLLGPRALVKVNTNIGLSRPGELASELAKLEAIAEAPYKPDMMMDHSVVDEGKPLWKAMVDAFDGSVGTLPHYQAFKEGRGIDGERLVERIREMADYGVCFMTLHPTATPELVEAAGRVRKVPSTSRGGALVIADMLMNGRRENVFAAHFEEILGVFRAYGMTLSVGTVFRPARISEALDEAHVKEAAEQKRFIDLAREHGVNVIMEGVGHLPYSKAREYFELVNGFGAPFMPLGPMPTDATVGFDHVTACVGAILADVYGNIGVINSVTRAEHTGGVPGIDDVVEGLKSARAVAHIINLARFPALQAMDDAVSDSRYDNLTCVVAGGLFAEGAGDGARSGCDRCDRLCPLLLTGKERD